MMGDLNHQNAADKQPEECRGKKDVQMRHLQASVPVALRVNKIKRQPRQALVSTGARFHRRPAFGAPGFCPGFCKVTHSLLRYNDG